MKKTYLILLSFFFVYSYVSAQIVSSVDIFAEYSKPGKKLASISKIDGVGAGVKLNFPIKEKFSLNLLGGLHSLFNRSR
jgi:hypothetical protein